GLQSGWICSNIFQVERQNPVIVVAASPPILLYPSNSGFPRTQAEYEVPEHAQICPICWVCRSQELFHSKTRRQRRVLSSKKNTKSIWEGLLDVFDYCRIAAA